jgi:hypothetical protein
VERCAELGLAVIAHSPLGGPKRAAGLARREPFARVAEAHGATAEEAALAWLLSLSPVVVPIPGARRPETARSAAGAATLRFEELAPASAPRPRARVEGDVVLVMGIQGSGKSRVAAEYVARGYVRLNRDERGGTLKGISRALDETLAGGARNVVLDNTYLTRAVRSYAIDAAAPHGIAVRCVWLDTPLAQAQINLVARLLERFGALPTPEDLRAAAKREAGLLLPGSQMRAVRELEPPSADEGLAAVERVPFAREAAAGRPGVFVAAGALPGYEPAEPTWPHLVFDWRPDAPADALADEVARLASEVAAPVEGAVCPHGGGPPACWCRPPLPGLPLAFARRHGVDPARSVLVGTGPAHRTLATALGARYVAA